MAPIRALNPAVHQKKPSEDEKIPLTSFGHVDLLCDWDAVGLADGCLHRDVEGALELPDIHRNVGPQHELTLVDRRLYNNKTQ